MLIADPTQLNSSSSRVNGYLLSADGFVSSVPEGELHPKIVPPPKAIKVAKKDFYI